MAKPFKRKPKDWLKNEQTGRLMEALSKVRNLPLEELAKLRNLSLEKIVATVRGGNASGTWIHEDIALQFAQ